MRTNEVRQSIGPHKTNHDAIADFLGMDKTDVKNLQFATRIGKPPHIHAPALTRMISNFIIGDRFKTPKLSGDKRLVDSLRRTMNGLIDQNFDLTATIEQLESTGQMFDRELLEKAFLVSKIQELDLKIHLICKV